MCRRGWDRHGWDRDGWDWQAGIGMAGIGMTGINMLAGIGREGWDPLPLQRRCGG